MDSASKHLFSHKIMSAQQIRDAIGQRPRQKKVIMCHGTFDVVHPGHVRHLLYAKTKADVVIASLTADEHIKKGNMRPYVPQDLRAMNLAALEMVDYVVVDSDATPLKNLAIIQPDYFAKGYEYTAGAVHPKTQEEIAVLDSYGGEVIFTPGDIVYSSSALIELAPPSIAVDKLMTLMEAEGVSFQDLRDTLDKLKGLRVHVVGDTIVDSYTYCSMIGGMTKTPTMSVRFERKVDYVGGAGVVAKHLRAAGADVTFSTVLGNDAYKSFVLDDLKAFGVHCLPIIDETRPTTNKNAIVAETYRMLKIDTLDNRSISDRIVEQLKRQIADGNSQAVVFSDFRHGMFNRGTIPSLTSAIPEGVFRVADSQVASRWGNILEFQNFDLITPNEREARFALGDQDSVVRPLALELLNRSGCGTLMLKCGERGIITYRSTLPPGDPRAFFSIDTFAGHVVDAVGAGDALLAYSTLALVATKNDVIASILGNMAAGVECEHDGNWPVTPELVLKKIDAVEKQARYE
ncbi:MAG: PfkB family carbohydrate kinase [Polaromonas sp.]|uniref:PfkB family carbohydrate kinase n=1 Tax=Polaromonas sp. TaxID=1869339 RepID=UPI002487EC6D|nr:PfkB family carbohydrate kinase [Polaromonas sp.]MDI1270396.1 PfkB family carbohydrate kinase [Polaromonas sp.]